MGRERELDRLEELLDAVRDGGSAALLVRGDPGVGKTALLGAVTASASGFQVARAAGLEGEVDLPYAGLEQLCRPWLDSIDALPKPQRDALRVAFGLSVGEPANRYVVGLGALGLMSEVAAAKPLLCVVDDAQWLDVETIQALAFVARRLGADSVGLVLAAREVVEELDGVPELGLQGLGTVDAEKLLDSALVGVLERAVRERFLAETHGNPLALIELPRTLTSAEGAPPNSLSSRIEESFRERLDPLPQDTRRLLLLASAEPLGDQVLLFRAASHLGVAAESADAGVEAGLIEIRERVSFRHPLVRSAVYESATHADRRQAHAALADATDGDVDPDRKAWHRAQATLAPDEEVAADLERNAERARSRGGLGAAAAFLERSAALTPDPDIRAGRALAATETMLDAGAYEAAARVLRSVDTDRLDGLDAARAERLDVEVSVNVKGADPDEIRRLAAIAERLMPLDPLAGRAALLNALLWAFHLPGGGGINAVIQALDEQSTETSGDPEPAELLLRGWAKLLGEGFPAGTDLLVEAMERYREKPILEAADLQPLFFAEGVSRSSWDFDNWESLTERAIALARSTGALQGLNQFLRAWVNVKVVAGDFAAAATAAAEADAVAAVIGERQEQSALALDVWRADETAAIARIDGTEGSTVRAAPLLDCLRAAVHNGHGSYEAALAAAQQACDRHPLGILAWALPELIEAAVRCDELERASSALASLVERTRVASTEWSLGLEARCTALVRNEEPLYQEAVERLGRARTRPDLGRAHLVYGEWLRRQGRRVDARQQLRLAFELFDEIGIPGFAERARRELSATGETARKRTDETRDDLTAQETQIARLAAEGLTNPEIGARLFLSPRTIEWHLRRVYPKLGISSRRELIPMLDRL